MHTPEAQATTAARSDIPGQCWVQLQTCPYPVTTLSFRAEPHYVLQYPNLAVCLSAAGVAGVLQRRHRSARRVRGGHPGAAAGQGRGSRRERGRKLRERRPPCACRVPSYGGSRQHPARGRGSRGRARRRNRGPPAAAETGQLDAAHAQRRGHAGGRPQRAGLSPG